MKHKNDIKFVFFWAKIRWDDRKVPFSASDIQCPAVNNSLVCSCPMSTFFPIESIFNLSLYFDFFNLLFWQFFRCFLMKLDRDRMWNPLSLSLSIVNQKLT